MPKRMSWPRLRRAALIEQIDLRLVSGDPGRSPRPAYKNPLEKESERFPAVLVRFDRLIVFTTRVP